MLFFLESLLITFPQTFGAKGEVLPMLQGQDLVQERRGLWIWASHLGDDSSPKLVGLHRRRQQLESGL